MGKGAYQRLLLVFWSHISKKMTGKLLNLIFFLLYHKKWIVWNDKSENYIYSLEVTAGHELVS